MTPPGAKFDEIAFRLYAWRMSQSVKPAAEPQAAAAVLLVRPGAFGRNAETAATNYFQAAAPAGADAADLAVRELDALAAGLAAAGVRVHVFRGQSGRAAPDEVFPNNWLSLHADGTAVLYPLQAPSRRRERRRELLDELGAAGYAVARVVDLTHFENEGQYLEGTGSVVLDRTRRVAYACGSARTHAAPLAQLGKLMGYEVLAFGAVDRAGRPIYHTNVMLSVGPTFAAVCSAAITDPAQRARVLQRLRAGGREIVDLTFDQLHAFAGNMLALTGSGGTVIALSTAAHAALDSAQIRTLEAHGRLVAADVRTIERYGGGSVRCMLAEVHLPRAARGVNRS
jgi:hypothetical protein